MIISSKEAETIQDLQKQEETCIQKYSAYAGLAKDPELCSLFGTLKEKEEKHYQSLGQVLNGTVPACDCNDSDGKDYQPTACYGAADTEDKRNDNFLATDCIGTEKLVSSTYNNDVFSMNNSDVRKLLADIQVEEQNHAEMLWKYKTVNSMM